MALAKIIKYEGDNETFVWKSPIEDFNTMSQLIVHQSQEAVFFKNGQALDLFEAGRYTLDTQNIPLIRRFLNLPTGMKTPFHCEVYFINKAQQMAIKWGTDSQVQYMEPTYKFPLQIGASGEMSLSVRDSRRLLVKLIGTETGLTQNGLVAQFRSFLMSKIKPYIAHTMQNATYSIFEVDAHMDEFSESLKVALTPDFLEYGISLDQFFVTTIAKPDGETAYEKFKDIYIRQYSDIAAAQIQQKVDIIEQETEARKLVIESEAIAKKRTQEGYTYQQERGFDVAEKVAENEAVGEFTNMGVGLGTMAGVGGAVGGMVGGMMNDAVGQSISPNYNNVQDNSLEAFKIKLEKLKIMKDSGLISDEEFNVEKQKLLSSL
ncbi:SPFH domain-containing protein [Gallibacter intestinalis]|uniref:SPFH domain-containing protein n=1 Tax=Gallibacter intestinalis TaxID=2779356 RepID=A0ABR9QX74_9FIRM|nr:SPFH domain-containing protein [Gallibacter intestinalis]MBE5035468.1 SPFH domain-containing protein [Gallibacter intestinalis]